MGIFGQSTPFDADVEKATSETNTNEDWTLILDVCDKVTSNPRNAKECLKSIMKRMGHADPHVVIQALTLLDACCNNCGKPFHLEVASREFENEYRRLLSKAQTQVSLKMRQILKNWAENDFKNDTQLNLIPSFYHKLKSEGYDFSNLNEKPTKSPTTIAALKDPNVVSSQQEEEDIAKAIELSLKESKNSPKKLLTMSSSAPSSSSSSSSAYPSLYPSISSSSSGSLGSISATVAQQPQPEPRKVRALYDFEAAEENELTFLAGEIIYVTDDTDPNWWKGYNSRGEGLFPSNFATADLSAETDRIGGINQKSKRSVKFEDEIKKNDSENENDSDLGSNAINEISSNSIIEIDEAKIDRLLHLLHEANPEDPSQDTDEMLRLEREVHQMGPLIDAELERVDRKHAQLTQLSSDLVDAINLYHTLMRDDRAAIPTTGYVLGMPMTAGALSQPQSIGYNQQTMLFGYSPYMAAAHNQHNHFQMPPPPGAVSSAPMHSYPPMSTINTQSTGIPQTIHNVPGNTVNSGTAPFNPQMIPVQFQNGRLSTPQMNGNTGIASPAIATSQQTPPQHAYNSPQQQQQQQQQQGYPLPSQPPPPPQQQPQQQQQQQSQIPMNQSRQQHPGQIASSMPSQQPAVSGAQFLHHQQQQQQFAPPSMRPQYPPNGQFINTTAPGGQPTEPMMCNPGIMLQQAPLSTNHNNDFSRQVVAASINQPVTQNFLMQNESKNNIPIYQQQR